MRAFIGIEIPEEVAAKYTDLCTPFQECCRATYERPNKMHITLAFFQSLSPDNFKKVDTILHEVESPFIQIDCDKFGSFDRRGVPSVLLVSIVSQQLHAYTNEIRRRLLQEGILFDTKPFNPHLTLARVKSIENKQKFQMTYNSVGARCVKSTFLAKNVYLYQSANGEYIKQITVDLKPE